MLFELMYFLFGLSDIILQSRNNITLQFHEANKIYLQVAYSLYNAGLLVKLFLDVRRHFILN